MPWKGFGIRFHVIDDYVKIDFDIVRVRRCECECECVSVPACLHVVCVCVRVRVRVRVCVCVRTFYSSPGRGRIISFLADDIFTILFPMPSCQLMIQVSPYNHDYLSFSSISFLALHPSYGFYWVTRIEWFILIKPISLEFPPMSTPQVLKAFRTECQTSRVLDLQSKAQP